MYSLRTISAVAMPLLLSTFQSLCSAVPMDNSRVLANRNTVAANQENDLLSLIDCKTALSIGFRKPSEMIEKSQQISDRAKLATDLNIDVIVDSICDLVKLDGCVDKSKPVVISLGTPHLFSIRVLLSVTDVKSLASNLKISAEELQNGEIHKIPNPTSTLISSLNFVQLQGQQVTMSSSESLLDTLKPEDSLLGNLSSKDKEILANDDMVIVLGQAAFDGYVRDYLNYLVNPSQKDTLTRFFDDLRCVVSGIHIAHGIGTTTIANLKSSDSTSLVGESFDSTRDSTLAKLPSGKILATHALQADSKTTGGLLGSLLSITRNAISNQITRLSIDSESYLMDSLLGTALDRIKGGHLVLYENSDRNRNGDFSLLGVLTTDDADAFIKDLSGLAPFVNAASMSESELATSFPQAKIDELVTELGESHYQRRELAKFKLKLLGACAVPALEKAASARDLELRLAARELLESVRLDAATARTDLIKGSLFKQLKPRFTYAPQQETMASTDIGMLTMKLEGDAQQARNKMDSLFGPEWQTARVATTGNEVLLLLGSETSILEKAIAKQKLPDNEVMTHKACRSFRERARDETIFEFHLAISRLAYLLDLGISEDKSANTKEIDRVSSFGLTIKEKQIRMDTYTPPQDVKATLEGGIPLLFP